MNWSDVGSKIAQYAPIAGAALSSPFGAVTAVGSLIASAFGVKSTPEDVAKFIDLNPERAADLLKAEMEHNIQLKNLINQAKTERNRASEAELKILADDQNSARQREMSVKDKTPAILALAFTAGYFLTVYLSKFLNLTESTINSMGNLEMLILAYYFGNALVHARNK